MKFDEGSNLSPWRFVNEFAELQQKYEHRAKQTLVADGCELIFGPITNKTYEIRYILYYFCNICCHISSAPIASANALPCVDVVIWERSSGGKHNGCLRCCESTFVWSFTRERARVRVIVNKARTQNIHTHGDITIYVPMSTTVPLRVCEREWSFLSLHAKNQKDKGGARGSAVRSRLHGVYIGTWWVSEWQSSCCALALTFRFEPALSLRIIFILVSRINSITTSLEFRIPNFFTTQ